MYMYIVCILQHKQKIPQLQFYLYVIDFEYMMTHTNLPHKHTHNVYTFQQTTYNRV